MPDSQDEAPWRKHRLSDWDKFISSNNAINYLLSFASTGEGPTEQVVISKESLSQISNELRTEIALINHRMETRGASRVS